MRPIEKVTVEILVKNGGVFWNATIENESPAVLRGKLPHQVLRDGEPIEIRIPQAINDAALQIHTHILAIHLK